MQAFPGLPSESGCKLGDSCSQQRLSCHRQLISSACPMSHTFALWAWPLDLKGPHLTVIPLFTCVHGLQASNSQEREGQPLAPGRRPGQQAQLGDYWKNYILRLFRPRG